MQLVNQPMHYGHIALGGLAVTVELVYFLLGNQWVIHLLQGGKEFHLYQLPQYHVTLCGRCDPGNGHFPLRPYLLYLGYLGCPLLLHALHLGCRFGQSGLACGQPVSKLSSEYLAHPPDLVYPVRYSLYRPCGKVHAEVGRILLRLGSCYLKCQAGSADSHGRILREGDYSFLGHSKQRSDLR